MQYATPDDLLAAPKNAFIESFLGEDRAFKRLSLVKVKEAVSDNIGTVAPDDTLATALERMDDYGYKNAILVVNKRHQPIGIINYALARITRGICRDHLQKAPPSIELDDNLHKAASLMYTADTTWLPCIDAKGRLSGQITQQVMSNHLAARFRSREEQE